MIHDATFDAHYKVPQADGHSNIYASTRETLAFGRNFPLRLQASTCTLNRRHNTKNITLVRLNLSLNSLASPSLCVYILETAGRSLMFHLLVAYSSRPVKLWFHNLSNNVSFN